VLGTGPLASSLVDSVLIIGARSFMGLGSIEARGPLGIAGASGRELVMPFGRFDAEEAGRCRLFSIVD
jgi:hypothetical protein